MKKCYIFNFFQVEKRCSVTESAPVLALKRTAFCSGCRGAEQGGHRLGVQNTRRKGDGRLLLTPFLANLTVCFQGCERNVSDKSSSRYLLIQTKTGCNPLTRMFREKWIPGLYSCESQILTGKKRVKRSAGESGERHWRYCISCTDCNKMQAEGLNDFKTSPGKAGDCRRRGRGFSGCQRVLRFCCSVELLTLSKLQEIQKRASIFYF